MVTTFKAPLVTGKPSKAAAQPGRRGGQPMVVIAPTIVAGYSNARSLSVAPDRVETAKVSKKPWFDQNLGELSLHKMIVDGVEVTRLLRFMKSNQQFTSEELSNALRISTRTLSRLIDGEGVSLNIPQGEGLVGLLQAVTLGNQVFGSETACLEWFRKPALGLDGHRPIDLLSTSFGTKLVMSLLNRIEYGAYS